jgi:hypothetical protein
MEKYKHSCRLQDGRKNKFVIRDIWKLTKAEEILLDELLKCL